MRSPTTDRFWTLGLTSAAKPFSTNLASQGISELEQAQLEVLLLLLQGPAALGVHGPPVPHSCGGAGHCGPYGLWHFGLRIKIGEKVDGGVAGLPVS